MQPMSCCLEWTKRAPEYHQETLSHRRVSFPVGLLCDTSRGTPPPPSRRCCGCSCLESSPRENTGHWDDPIDGDADRRWKARARMELQESAMIVPLQQPWPHLLESGVDPFLHVIKSI